MLSLASFLTQDSDFATKPRSPLLPGALVGAGLWVAAAAALSYTLRTAGKLALIYGSFAGVVGTLVFLYVSATTLIYGAEINAVLREKKSPSNI
ncbi:MAG: hypothetical protein EOO23_01420 [Comamonadaceae bacterium]|nr:MAG: hypothetical protein EOO23_01420 [Comamonadaceae bacterium]